MTEKQEIRKACLNLQVLWAKQIHTGHATLHTRINKPHALHYYCYILLYISTNNANFEWSTMEWLIIFNI